MEIWINVGIVVFWIAVAYVLYDRIFADLVKRRKFFKPGAYAPERDKPTLEGFRRAPHVIKNETTSAPAEDPSIAPPTRDAHRDAPAGIAPALEGETRPHEGLLDGHFDSPPHASDIRATPPYEVSPPITRQPSWWQRKAIVISAGGALLLALVGAVALALHELGDGAPAPPQARGYRTQVVLPFTGLDQPHGVAVDASGSVYLPKVNPSLNDETVLKLPLGASNPEILPFNGLQLAMCVAVDSAGTVFLADTHAVLKLPAGAMTQETLPFGDLQYPSGLAVDGHGDVYVADTMQNRVLKLPAGSHAPQVLPFSGIDHPDGVAVDTGGTVYVVDGGHNRVVKLAPGAASQNVLPFRGLNLPEGIAVDKEGSVYVTDTANHRVLRLSAGSSEQEVLPFTGLDGVDSVAVDQSGNVYVTDNTTKMVLRLPRA